MSGGKRNRTKGARGERELAKLLMEHLPLEIRRNLVQYQIGGVDLTGLPWSLEVKRHETISIGAFWSQCVSQAEPGKPPALAYRASRQPWRFVVPAHLVIPHYAESLELEHTLTMQVNPFVQLTRLRLGQNQLRR